VLFSLRILAGETRQRFGKNDGSLQIEKARPMSLGDVIAWLAQAPGTGRKAAGDMIGRLETDGFVKVTRAGYVRVVGWRDEQEAVTQDTKHKRASRRRQSLVAGVSVVRRLGAFAMSRDAFVGELRRGIERREMSPAAILDLLLEDGSVLINGDGMVRPPPSPRPPTNHDNLTTDDPDMSGGKPLTCQVESEVDKKTKTLSTCRLSTGRGEGGGEDLYLLSQSDPVRCAMLVTRGRGESNQNIFGAKLRALREARGREKGTAEFADLVMTLHSELRAGEHKRMAGDLPKLLTSRFNKALKGPQRRMRVAS